MPEPGVRPVPAIQVSAALDSVAALFVDPPVMTRLEPQSVSGDPAPGVEARVADPLWLLARQWQLGELLGEDAGSPVSLRVRHRGLPVTAWTPDGDGAPPEPAWRPWPRGALLEELVEHVPRSGHDRGLRRRAATGATLAEMLRESGHDDAAEALLAACPLTAPVDPGDPTGALDPAADRLTLLLGGTVPDGVDAADQLAAGTASWLEEASDPTGAAEVAAGWATWAIGGPTGGAARGDDRGGAWSTPRLEHRFRLRFGAADDAVVVRAERAPGGRVRWHDLRWEPDARVDLDDDQTWSGPLEAEARLLATPLRYAGQPADRYWQLEDGAVDVAAIEAQAHDLARLCLADFALVAGDDWLVVPLDGWAGAVNQVRSVEVQDTFGRTTSLGDLSAAATARHGEGFRLFEVTSADGRELDGLVLPPTGATALTGEPVEEVAFVRDEAANLGWAVEKVVPGRSGDGRRRQAEPQRERPRRGPGEEPGDLHYELMAPVPRHWIPLVPVRTGPATVALRKGALLADGERVPPVGVLLAPTPLDLPPEELPREGVTVTAVPVLARRRDGSYARWTGHRVRVGRGEASSGLAFDAARPPDV